MRRHLYLILYSVLLWLPVTICAQESRNIQDIYVQAENDYKVGQLEQAIELLNSNQKAFQGNIKQNVYRLMALCYLALDDEKQTEHYAMLLLDENPYYTSVQDPVRFQEMISRLKGGVTATITTASRLAENVEDAPVPVTLITEEMIQASTARTLLELLSDYVPGVNIVEGEEPNFSMRGMFSYSQEDVLIMLNGERLNSYCTNSIAPDYRIALNNIKQIEVLRGAASSLYGNVALSAVVNIITKQGAEVDGLKASIGAGNEHAVKGDFLLGKHYLNSDLLLWGSVYKSNGYKHDIPASDPDDGYGIIPIDGSIYVNGYNNKPAYNLGMIYKWRNLKFQFNHFSGKRLYTYCNLFLPSVYDYERYSPVDEMKPGRGVTSTNASVVYQNNWNNLTLETGLSSNYEQTELYNVIGDILPTDDIVYEALWGGYDDGPKLQITEGSFQTQSWRNYNISGVLKLMYNYDAGNLGKGDLLAGVQYDYFNLYYHDMSVGDIFDRVLYTAINDYDPLIKNNHETNYSIYSQLKHNFNDHFILNVGLRFDNKERYSGSAKRVFSPRAALIWKPNKKTAFKLSYSRSFVDAPYFYRASERIYKGNDDLTPQYLDNIQLTGIFKIPSLHLEYESNIFYTNVQDIINLAANSFMNSGIVKSIGFENILTYRYKDWMARGSLYTHKILKSEGVSANDDEIYSIPNWTAHVQVSKMFFDHLRLMTNLSYTSKCKCKVSEFIFQNGEPTAQTEREFPACFVADLGAAYQWKGIELSVKCKNLFNKKYRYGGDRVPVLQEGRNFLATLTLNIKN